MAGKKAPTKLALMISKEKLAITEVTMLDRNTVEINARGPKRSPRNLTVHFDRHGVIRYANLHEPDYLINERDTGFISLEFIPKVILEAAMAKYKENAVT